jgi:dTDP-4-amino-4,6-dideoxygalactose transaminase
LRYLDIWNAGRQAVAERYHQLLEHVPGIVLPHAPEQGHHVWNQYTICIPESERTNRDRVRQHLQQQGIISMIYYPLPLHLQPVYQSLGYQPGQLPVSEQLANQVLSLPMYPELTLEQQERVVYALKDSMS